MSVGWFYSTVLRLNLDMLYIPIQLTTKIILLCINHLLILDKKKHLFSARNKDKWELLTGVFLFNSCDVEQLALLFFYAYHTLH